MKRYIIPIVLGVALVLGGVLLYWHFVIDQVLDRNGMENPFPPDDTELPGIPMDAALLSLNWSQSAMSFAECFHFDLAAEDSGYVISGECADPENGERVERENAPLTAEDWAKVEQCLRDGEHRAKTSCPRELKSAMPPAVPCRSHGGQQRATRSPPSTTGSTSQNCVSC